MKTLARLLRRSFLPASLLAAAGGLAWLPPAAAQPVVEAVIGNNFGHLSYMMIATVHDPMVTENPKLVQAFVNGLAAASYYTRQNRGEAVEIFAKWVPNVNLDVARKAIQHISYDPRISRESLRAFENAQNDLLKLTIKDAQPLKITDIVHTTYTEAVQKAHPEYFKDLPALPR